MKIQWQHLTPTGFKLAGFLSDCHAKFLRWNCAVPLADYERLKMEKAYAQRYFERIYRQAVDETIRLQRKQPLEVRFFQNPGPIVNVYRMHDEQAVQFEMKVTGCAAILRDYELMEREPELKHVVIEQLTKQLARHFASNIKFIPEKQDRLMSVMRQQFV